MPWDDLQAEIEDEFSELQEVRVEASPYRLIDQRWALLRELYDSRRKPEQPDKRRARDNAYKAKRRTDPEYRAHKAALERARYARKVGRPVKRRASPASRYKRRHGPV